MRLRPAVGWCCGGLVGALVWSEYRTWRASRDDLPPDRLDPRVVEPGEAVLVLGYRSGERINFLQRWRTRIAVRSTDPRTARFVFTGATTRGGPSEAALMARYAVRLGVPPANITLEEQARTTWENITCSIPLLAGAPTIKIASDTYHARKARRYLAKQSPALAPRLRRARDYIPGELTFLKPLFLLHARLRHPR